MEKITFEIIIPHLLRAEGGYVNNVLDRGGETNMGISKRAYPNEDIKNMTAKRATQIYLDIWERSNVQLLPEPLRYIVFDMVVNSGANAAVRCLQRTCGMKFTDGKIGTFTAKCCEGITLTDFYNARLTFYNNIVKRNPTQSIFLDGWKTRLNRVVDFSLNLLNDIKCS